MKPDNVHQNFNKDFDNQIDKNIVTTPSHNSECKVDWQTVFHDDLLTQFTETGFIVFDDVFSLSSLEALQCESGYIQYNEANLTTGQRIDNIRGDKTHWIDELDIAGTGYLQAIDELGQFCNRTFYTGIRFCEAHYACYPKGFGYQWHKDNPKGRDERVLSAVFYLNNDWTQADGGALEIIDKNKHSHTVLPQANRLIVFESNLLHQVQVAHRQRYSIATWLRNLANESF